MIAFLSAFEGSKKGMDVLNLEHSLVSGLSENGYYLLGTILFMLMGWILYRIGLKRDDGTQKSK
jgi:hypothetical protein